MISGIYRILNLLNFKGYVGSAKSFEHRWGVHKWLLQSNQHQHHSPHLQHAWNKYGESNFRFEILQECDESKLLYFEQIWMDSLCSYDPRFGYNVCPIAGSCLGRKHSDETKKKMSEAQSGEKNAGAKLSWKKVKEIRERYLLDFQTQEQLTEEFGVVRSEISQIILNHVWKDSSLGEDYQKKAAAQGSVNRQAGPRKNHFAKLSLVQVSEIREKYLSGRYTQEMLAEEFGVIPATICGIIKNKTRKSGLLREEYLEAAYLMRLKNCRQGAQKKSSVKLTWAQVRRIREKYCDDRVSQRDLAKEFEVSQHTIHSIVNNKIWREN